MLTSANNFVEPRACDCQLRPRRLLGLLRKRVEQHESTSHDRDVEDPMLNTSGDAELPEFSSERLYVRLGQCRPKCSQAVNRGEHPCCFIRLKLVEILFDWNP